MKERPDVCLHERGKSGVLKSEGGFLSFTSDYRFSSASAAGGCAAATVIGASANGGILWKLPEGRSYADWEADRGEVADTPNNFMNSENAVFDQ